MRMFYPLLLLTFILNASVFAGEPVCNVILGGGMRSNWAKSETIQRIQAPFTSTHLRHGSERLLPIQKGSLGDRVPELVQILDDLNYFQISYPQFLNQHTQLKRGGARDIQQIAKFYRSRHQILLDGVNEIVRLMKEIDRDKARWIERSYVVRAEALRFLPERAANTIYLREVQGLINGYNMRVSGIIGELYGAFSLAGVKTGSIRMADVPRFRDRINEWRQQTTEQLKNDPEILKILKERYPTLFSGESFGLQDLNRIHEKLLGKEIDLLRVVDEKPYWIEIKLNREAYHWKSFSEPPHVGSKSARSQILENKELIELLGLSCGLEFLAPAGMSTEVRGDLERNGISVIQVK